MPTIKEKLLLLATEAERRGLDNVSADIASLFREASAHSLRLRIAAKSDQIEIDSWPDFLGWWNNNRGQNLSYIFVDTYGPNSEQVRLVKKLVKDAEKHEKDLHEFYMKLRDLASSNNLPGADDKESLSLSPGSGKAEGGDDDTEEGDVPDLGGDLDLGDDLGGDSDGDDDLKL